MPDRFAILSMLFVDIAKCLRRDVGEALSSEGGSPRGACENRYSLAFLECRQRCPIHLGDWWDHKV
jgi:hypothetical protein